MSRTRGKYSPWAPVPSRRQPLRLREDPHSAKNRAPRVAKLDPSVCWPRESSKKAHEGFKRSPAGWQEGPGGPPEGPILAPRGPKP
eukprot:1883751-Pyramimonas_sp.AAC.1